MAVHDVKVALRNLGRNKLFTGINIAGLSMGIAVFLALAGYVKYQLGYDKFYKDGGRIFRVDYYEYQEGQPVLQSARTHDRTALLVHEYVPQVEAVARFYPEKAYIFTEDTRIVDQDMLFADSSFFKVFGVRLISGSPASCLIPPNAVVISQSQAEVYFGKNDPLGKTLYFNERLPVVVTGVFEDIPENSSIDFDFLVSMSTIWYYGWGPREGSFRYPWCFTFVKLKEHQDDLTGINARLTELMTTHHTALVNLRHTARQELRPIENLHIESGLSGEIKPGANLALLFSLVFLAFFILVAAWINYVNLSLARSLERAAEIGVRKVLGATRLTISTQFIVEALILCASSVLLGYGLFYLSSGPAAQVLFGKVVFESPARATSALYILLFVSGSILAALYPAYLISKYNPALILYNKIGSTRGSGRFLHQSLMVFQLFLAISVIGITLMASMQIEFIGNYDKGFDTSHTISLRAPASTNSDSLRLSRYRAFRNDVLKESVFESGCASMNIPGEEIRYHDEGVRPIGSVNEKKNAFWVMWVDEGYQQTFGTKLLGGRNFNPEERGHTCLINETGARALGYENPADAVNTQFTTQDSSTVTVVGVWKDYHHESLRKPVGPIIFYYKHPHEYGYYSFRLSSTDGRFLESLKSTWARHYPNDTFNFYFMDRFFAEQYSSDRLFARLLSLFSTISIAVACLGLLGMATLAAVRRTKEIGVRKVLGASVWNIMNLLSRSYIRLIIVSCLLAFPASYYLASQWLSGFAYKIDITWWMIIVPGVVVLLAALLAISAQSIRAAFVNPVKSLKEQ